MQGALREKALDVARRAEAINEARYRAGEIALRDVLETQDRRRAAEVALIDNRLARLAEVVDLQSALGGEARGVGTLD